MLTITPDRRARIKGSAARHIRPTPKTLTSNWRWISASVASSTVPRHSYPLPANKRAVAFPIPDVAPVITVTLPMRNLPRFLFILRRIMGEFIDRHQLPGEGGPVGIH